MNKCLVKMYNINYISKQYKKRNIIHEFKSLDISAGMLAENHMAIAHSL